MTSQATEPRVYVACLASYNNGTLHGAWINLEGADADTIQEEIDAMLAASPAPDAEEYAIHDHEGLCGLLSGESASADELAEIAEAIEEIGDDAEAFEAYCNCYGANGAPSDLVEQFREAFQGVWGSEQDFAENLADDTGLLDDAPETLRTYFDWEAWTRDLFMGGDYSSHDVSGGVAVFSSY